MYESYWNLKCKPFENVPDPNFFYKSEMHEEAYIRLLYAIRNNKGAAMLSGEYGCGKTMLIRLLLAELVKEKYEIALINNPIFNSKELFQEILFEFGEEEVKHGDNLYRELGRLLYKNFEQGKKNIIVIDEAQLIKDEMVFEALRLLLNYQLQDHNLVNLILAGQPEIREKMMSLPQFEQRLAIKFHLYPFDLDDTRNYISHRLRVAGGNEEIFTAGAIEEIYKRTMGSPRRINNLCDLCLFYGFRKNKNKLDRSEVVAVS